jgi:hypothetical protein
VKKLKRAHAVAPKPTSAAPFELGLKLISSRLALNGTAIDLRFRVKCISQGYDSCAFYLADASVIQNVRGTVQGASVFKSYAASDRHSITLRLTAENQTRFKPGQAYIRANFEACFVLGCPSARIEGVVRVSR